jgi:hypothetical protein
MGSAQYHSVGVEVQPPLPEDRVAQVRFSPLPLGKQGFNIPVEISTASIFRQPPTPLPLNTLIVMAHFDTGATITSLSLALAQKLGFVSVGDSPSYTAAGLQVMPNFVADISFPNTTLSPFQNLKVGSCHLQFDPEKPPSPANFGLLLGRDVMSRWNIVWNGPTSTVLVND